MELGGPALLCIENLKGQPQVVWTPIGLCQTQTLEHSWEVQNEVWAAGPTGALWVALPAWKLDWLLYLGMALSACLSSENSGNLANQLGSV